MAARSIGSGLISFGLVTIPFKLYTAVSEQKIGFNMLHSCGSRVNQKLVCPAENNIEIDRADTNMGYEYSRDQYVTFTKEELEALKNSRPSSLTLEEFVPASSVDLLYIEQTYYLGPDKGGDAGYAVLAAALERKQRIGVGRYAKQGKDVLVLIRPYKGGLIMHEAYYANEVRSFSDVERSDKVTISEQHVHMAELLINQLDRPAFEPERFKDEWAEKVKAAVAAKVAGEPVIATPAPQTHVIDLLEALQRSVAANSQEIGKLRAEAPAAKGGPKTKKAVPRKAAAAKKKQRSGDE